MSVLLFFRYASISSVLLPLITGVLLWRHLDGIMRVLFWLVFASMFADLSSLILAFQKVNNWPVLNIFVIVQFILFYLIIEHDKNTFFSFVFLSCCIIPGIANYLFVQSPKTFNSYSAYSYAIVIIIVCLRFLYFLMKDMAVEKIQALPLFWLSFGALIYYAGTLFLFLFNNYLALHMPARLPNIWILHNFLNIAKNFFLFMTLWVNYKSKTSQS